MATALKPVTQLPAMHSGGKVMAIVPQSFGEIGQIADAVLGARMAPKSLDTKEKIVVAIMHGLELGLTPMAALQSIAVVNGNPAVYGDGMVALVRASGHLEDIKETVEWGKDGPVSATCEVKRQGETSWGKHTFTRADAVKAALWGKQGPWQQYPQRMLAMRARAWALRDKFADVLRGLRSAEEMEDMVDITHQGAATVSAVEPKRTDFTDKKTETTSPGASQPRDQAEGGQAAAPQVAAAGGTNAPSGLPAHDPETGEVKDDKPAVTDVVDENEKDPKKPEAGEKLEFMRFAKVADFADFAGSFLPETNAEGARQFAEFYEGTLIAMEKGKPGTQAAATEIRETIKKLIGEPPAREPGQEG